MARPDARAAIATRHRLRPIEALPWLLAIAAFVLLPDYAYLGTQVMILILFALSLDLILGYAGIVTLGHAAYFGLGAYTAGMLSAHLGWHEPITGLLAAAAAAALFGFLSGLILMRYHGLALLDADARGGLHAARDRQCDGLAHRRLRWPLRHHAGAVVRRLRERPLRPHLLLVRPHGPVPRLPALPPHRPLAVRPLAQGPARERAPYARDRLRRAAPQGRDLHHRDRARGARRRPVRPGQRLRLARRLQLRPLRHRADRAAARRQRPPLRRDPRRRRALSPRGSSCAAQPRVLAVRHRPGAGARGAVLARRAARPARPGSRPLARRRTHDRAGARHSRSPQELRRPRRHDATSISSCRAAAARR